MAIIARRVLHVSGCSILPQTFGHDHGYPVFGLFGDSVCFCWVKGVGMVKLQLCVKDTGNHI